MTLENGQPSPIDVHGTQAWVLITRDYPLSSLHMTYPEANKLQEDIRKVLVEHQVTVRDAFGPDEIEN